jgi:hypothetical protein
VFCSDAVAHRDAGVGPPQPAWPAPVRDHPQVTKPLAWLLLGLCAVVAGGGYFQVLESPIFWCGRSEAFPGTTILALISLGQTALYLAAAGSPQWAKRYRISQIVVLPVLAIGLFQVFLPHPRTAAFFAALAAIPVALSAVSVRWRWTRTQLPAICGLFVVSALGALAAFGDIPFSLRGVVVPTSLIGLCAAAAAVVAVVAVSSFTERISPAVGFTPDLARYLPLALLLFAVLRAKLPDIAYDSFTYKTTLPYQLAEWRTGDSAIIDGFMVGTNLQEILNALLVAITRDYVPPLLSTISFVLLLLITPLAFPVEQRSSATGRSVVAFAGASAFVLSEAGIAQGTAYQEPMLLLFLVAALIRCPLWPAFLAVAIAVKINAAFIAPLVMLYHLFFYRRFFLSPTRLLTGILAAALVLLPQLDRNVVFSGRLLAMTETLASVTDPPGPDQIMVAGGNRYESAVRGGILNNAALSACNMWLLATLCPMQYRNNDSAGFHVFPASRAPLFAVLFAAAVALGGRRSRRGIGLASVVVFGVCYVGLLAFLSEGRYFLPLSFGFSVLLLLNPQPAEDVLSTMGGSWPGRLVAVGLGCWFVGSDLIPGTFTNVSWICKREILTAAETLDMRQPETPAQRFLASYVDRYKQICPPPGLPPVILAEHDVLNSPYLGTQRIFHVFTQQMITRFFTADPTRQQRSGQAIIAVLSKNEGYIQSVLGPAAKDYTPCFDDGSIRIVCSTLLAPAAPHCATSLYRP